MIDMYRIIPLPDATTDLARIYDFIKVGSPQNAILFVRQLIATIDSLNCFPHRCKIHMSHRVADRVVRSISEHPYITYYRIIERDRVVEVMTIRHGARKQPRRFKR